MAVAKKSTEELKEYEEQFVAEVWNDRNYDLIDETISEDYVGHWFGIEEDDTEGREGLRAFVSTIHEGFSDFEMDVEFMVAEDDVVVVGFTTTATHDGELMGIPPTGRSGSVPGIFVHRFDEERMVVQAWATWDALGLMQQLEVVPEEFTLAEFLETAASLARSDIRKRTGR